METENMTFFGEEVILEAVKLKSSDLKKDPFSSTAVTEEKDILVRFKVIKIGQEQAKYKVGDLVLINKNGLPKEIKIEGVGVLEDIYSLPNHQRIFCKINV